MIKNIAMTLYIVVSMSAIGLLHYEWNKARVCNKVFVKYFTLYGINVDLDKLYKDGKTWVDDPKYNGFPHKRRK